MTNLNKLTPYLKGIDKMVKTNNILQEHINRILEPQRRFQKQINELMEPQLRLREQMESFFEPQRKLQEQMQRYFELNRVHSESMNELFEPYKRLQEQIGEYIEHKRIQELINDYLEPYHRLQEQIHNHLESHRIIGSQINKYFKLLNQYLSDPMIERIAINNEGLLSVGGEVVDAELLEASIDEISGDFTSYEEFFENFFALLKRLVKPVQLALIYLLLPYIIAIIANFTTPIYKEWWTEYAGKDHRLVKKEISRKANEKYSPKELKHYRFVYISILSVRRSGNMSAEIIGELQIGKIVRIIEKSKSWSYVEYNDSESRKLKQGWVLSKYLKKFDK